MHLKFGSYASEYWLRLARRNIMQWLNEPVPYEDVGDCSGLLCTTNATCKKFCLINDCRSLCFIQNN